MFKKQNYYQILGVSQTATIEEIKKAYRRLAVQYHPDVNPADETGDFFKELTRIYEILRNPLEREKYDQELAQAASSEEVEFTNKVPEPDIEVNLKDKQAVHFYQQGLKKCHKLNYQEAIADYTEALKLNPELVEAYYQRGFAQSQLSNHREAFADYTEALQRNDRIPEIYYYRGLTRFKLANIPGALEDLNQAIAMNPHYAAAYYHRGLVYQEIGDNKAAKISLKQAAKEFLAQGDRFQYRQTLNALENLQKTLTIIDKTPPPFRLLLQILKTWRAFAFNPIEGLFPAFITLGNRQAIAVGIGFSLIFNLCFTVGISSSWQKIYPFSNLPILTLIIMGLLPVFSLTGVSGLMRIIFQANGSFAGDLFITGAALLPLGLWVLLGGLMQNWIAIGILGIFAINYTILTLYSGCHEISLMSTAKSALTVPIMLLIGLLPLIFI